MATATPKLMRLDWFDDVTTWSRVWDTGALALLFHFLFLGGANVDSTHASNIRLCRVKAPTSAELTHLIHAIDHRVGRSGLERQGSVERDVENSSL